MATPLSKKRKIDESASSIIENRARAREAGLWFDDGNIILIAESTPFKVHKSMLSKKSEVFSDMFTIPQPEIQDETELIDGTPVVHMSDSWKDLSRILQAIYDGYRVFATQVPLPFAMISAFLRLGTKYDLADLRNLAISRLQDSFPTSLPSFQNQLSSKFAPRGIVDMFIDQQSAIEMTNADAIAVINLARTYDIPSTLPAAFYACSRLAPNELIYGVLDEDGVRSTLCPADLVRCWNGQHKLDQRYISAIIKLRGEIAGRLCLTRHSTHCREIKTDDNHGGLFKALGCCFAPKEGLEIYTGGVLCEKCIEARQRAWERFRCDIWKSLPKIFDLEESGGQADNVQV